MIPLIFHFFTQSWIFLKFQDMFFQMVYKPNLTIFAPPPPVRLPTLTCDPINLTKSLVPSVLKLNKKWTNEQILKK